MTVVGEVPLAKRMIHASNYVEALTRVARMLSNKRSSLKDLFGCPYLLVFVLIIVIAS